MNEIQETDEAMMGDPAFAGLFEAVTKIEKERDTYAEQLAGTLALLGEIRRALESTPCGDCNGKKGHWSSCRFCGDSTYDHECDEKWIECAACGGSGRHPIALAALALTPPEALAHLQEREVALEAGIAKILTAMSGWLHSLSLLYADGDPSADDVREMVGFLCERISDEGDALAALTTTKGGA